ncbi:MAG: hypothetical protein JO214_20690 [Frankiaceae bacterium]|nr:hypothetical protein [Frankiaceae bacterium]
MTEPSRRDEFATTEVIRPAAVLMEAAAREIIKGLARDDVREGGHWLTSPGVWQRYDRPWADGAKEPGEAVHLGTIRSIYDSPQRYFVTIFRASITPDGLEQGWSVETLCDDAMQHAGLTLAECPRAGFAAAPLPFRIEAAQAAPEPQSEAHAAQ